MKREKEHTMEFKQQYDSDSEIVSVSIHRDSDISSIVLAFKKFLLACGYHPDNVKEHLGEEW